jgi:hypothetical protein
MLVLLFGQLLSELGWLGEVRRQHPRANKRLGANTGVPGGAVTVIRVHSSVARGSSPRPTLRVRASPYTATGPPHVRFSLASTARKARSVLHSHCNQPLPRSSYVLEIHVRTLVGYTASGCGPEGRGFEPRRSPSHLQEKCKQCPSHAQAMPSRARGASRPSAWAVLVARVARQLPTARRQRGHRW